MHAVVLLSGGMDSCVALAITLAEGYKVSALHVNYGQLTESRELSAFQDICNHYNITDRLVVNISHLVQIGGSSLTDARLPMGLMPGGKEHGTGHSERGTVPNTYVPFRNANILAIATSWAEVIAANAITIGAVEEDSSGYPDCRESFFTAFDKVISEGTKPGAHIRVLTPVIHFHKAEIVKKGLELHAPLHLTWSCYCNEKEACGECDSCRLRLRGFEMAGFADPIPYS